ncbi:MAG TPA: hypothetical protein VFI49_07830 [Rudaea sp.]|nr:hypothetical protein [Rudaea sp.]
MAPTTTPTRMSAWLEQAWLIQYLDRQLAGEEAQWFETYAMERRELLATIEADTRLRDALAAAASIRHTDVSVDGGGRPGGAADNTLTAIEEPGGIGRGGTDAGSLKLGNGRPAPVPIKRIPPRSRSNVRQWRATPTWLALAASLLLGIGVGGLGRSARSTDVAPGVIASPTRIIYDTMRGDSTPARIEHATSQSAYVLVEVAVPLGAERVTLDVGDGKERALDRSPDGFVTFLADRNTLAAAADAHVSYSAGGRTQMRSLSLKSKGSLK